MSALFTILTFSQFALVCVLMTVFAVMVFQDVLHKAKTITTILLGVAAILLALVSDVYFIALLAQALK